MCAPHTCVCGAESRLLRDSPALPVANPPVRHMRHNAVSDLIKRALASADIPALLEPKSLSRDDGKRPDSLTVLPWANGRCLVLDFTCPDTMVASHLNRAVVSPGSVANDSEDRKSTKYLALAPLYNFKPIAVETLGAQGECATDFFQNLGQRISVATGDRGSGGSRSSSNRGR